MKNTLHCIIAFLIVTNVVTAQSSLELTAQQFSDVTESKNYDIRIIDITDESQLMFNKETLTFEEFENNIIETKTGYTFFNKESIDFYYIGFYKKHDIVWDTYKMTFIMNLPKDLKGSCNELPIIVNFQTVGGAYLSSKRIGKMSMEDRKTLAIQYISESLEYDCKEVTLDIHNSLLGFDSMPLGGLKIKYGNDKN